MYEFRMPSLGADMEAGRLTRWLVKPGDRVERGDVVAVVETEKSDIDVEIWGGGTVDRIVVAEGERVPVGTLLAMLREDGASASAAQPPSSALAPPVAGTAPSVAGAAPPATPAVAPSSPGPTAAPIVVPTSPPALAAAPLRASPAARRRAEELGVDLAKVRGSGPGGAVQVGDVETAAAAAPAPGERKASAMRHAIAALVERSKREIPHYYLATDVEVCAALDWLRCQNESRPIAERLLPAALLLKAVALALRRVPELNGFWIDGALETSAAVHIGVAISLRGGGLLAPALRDVDRRSVPELMAALQDLVARARSGGLRSSEMSGATITVTNLGDEGVDTVLPVIYPPQVAIVGLGRIRERPWAQGGVVSALPVLTVSLAADHRASDGHRGGIFLDALGKLLQAPEKL